jgi:DNA-binding response OmpR family regulator
VFVSLRPVLVYGRPPRPSGEHRDASETSSRPSESRKVPRRILIVEDNVDSGQTLAILLKHEGHHVELAINGRAALNIAKQFRPQVVLLDLGLPDLDGFEVCARLKREPGSECVRVIAITGYGSDEYRIKASAAGCDRHFTKPYDLERLLSAIHSL